MVRHERRISNFLLIFEGLNYKTENIKMAEVGE